MGSLLLNFPDERRQALVEQGEPRSLQIPRLPAGDEEPAFDGKDVLTPEAVSQRVRIDSDALRYAPAGHHLLSVAARGERQSR